MEVFALLNGFEIIASVDEQEQIILNTAAGKLSQPDLTAWLRDHLVISN